MDHDGAQHCGDREHQAAETAEEQQGAHVPGPPNPSSCVPTKKLADRPSEPSAKATIQAITRPLPLPERGPPPGTGGDDACDDW